MGGMWYLVPGPYGATFILSLCFKPPYPKSKIANNVYHVSPCSPASSSPVLD